MLKDRVIVIAGGAGLLGREFVKSVYAEDAHVICADISLEAAEKVCLETGMDRAVPAHLDITSKASLNNLIRDLDERFGRIDAFVNSAYPKGPHYGRKLFDVEYDDFCKTLDINLGGYFLASQQFASYFKDKGQGNIINISSIYGVVAPIFEIYDNTPMTMPVEYAAIKSALIHLTSYFAAYLKGCGVRVNCISSGGIFDSQPEAFLKKYKEKCLNKGMLDKTDLSGTLLYLLSGMSAYVNGQNIIVDDGFTL